MSNINRNGEITTYSYDPIIKGRVNGIELKDKNSQVKNRQTFTYDPTNITDRVTNVKEEIADISGNLRIYNTDKEYDALGRIKKEIYPSGYYTLNTYDNYSNLTEVKDNVRSIWKADAENALGQAISIYKGAKKTTYTYDLVNHQTTSIYADGIIDYTYGYYDADDTHHANNLAMRADGIKNQSEHFSYDPQNRLTNWDVTQSGITTYNSMSFDDNGNINHKSDLGAFTLKYGGEKEDGTGISSTIKSGVANEALTGTHALTTISGVPAIPFPQVDLNVTYTDFKKIATLDEGTKHYEITYGADDQRRMSVYYANGKSLGVPPTLTRYYLGDYEEEVGADGKVRKIHYLSGAILIQNEGKADSLLYTYHDAQGSLIVLTDADGNLLTKSINGKDEEIGRFAYDPWGVRRDPTDWNLKDSRTSFIINRGYTGHEHLDAFGIINMNGRVYDPLTAQFFSPDPNLQSPDDWLNYNRYGYCMGNPFRYTDPSGNSWLTTIAGIAVGVGVTVLTAGVGAGPGLLLAASILGASASNATSAILSTALNGGSFGDCFLAGVKGTISGGATAMLTGGTGVVGDLFGHNVGTIGHELLRAGSHATLSGLMYVAQGGDFKEGFAVGAVSSLVGSGLQAAGVGPVLGILACGAAGAGTGALMGGDPVKGFFQGVAIGALNHYVKQPDGRFMWEGPETTIYGHHTILGQTAAWWARSSGAINQVNVEFDVILGARLIYSAASAAVSEAGANKGVTVIGEGMGRVEAAASKIPGSVILNDMPAFTGNVEQVTSQMMQYNRQWMLDQLRSGNTIIDIGIDINRAQPSIFYQMEQNMIKNYRFLHP